MNKKSFSLFSSRHLITLCYILIIASVCCILIIITSTSSDDQAKFYRNYYPDIQSITRLKSKFSETFLNSDTNEGKTTDLLTTQSQTSTQRSSAENPGNGYRINTNGCKIKSLPLFDNETIKLFENKTEIIWKCNQSLIEIKRFDETSIRLNYTKLDYKPFCFHRQLSRGSDDFNFKYGAFSGPIENSTIDFPDFDFVHIICYQKENNSKDVNKYYNSSDKSLIHNQIIPLIPMKEKRSDSNVPNILLLAIDSTSYINFQRHFIRTQRFLKQNNFFEMRGYTKVGINTWPNMIPFFTGHHPDEIITYTELMKANFDDWPIIWKNYSQNGFITTFVEEMGTYGLFQFKAKGFKQKPTDYETRPFHMEIRPNKYNDFCYLDKTETEHSLDFTYDFLKAMNKRQQKYFAYISISEMTHDWLNAGHYMDVPYFQLLTKIFNEKLVENTVIMFFSDHGLRMGPIRQTRTGEVENRLPFMFIHLPENTDQKLVENLKRNQYRLTTHFDSHATLVHLFNGEPDPTLPHGLSLLDDKIDENRDCSIASIPDQFCSCYEDIEIQDHNVIKLDQTIPMIMGGINYWAKDYRSKCAEFEFESINTIYLRRLTSTCPPKDDSNVYIVQLYANPGKALFETIVKGYENNTRFERINEVIRINKYGNQSHCISHKIIKNFCFCKDLLKIK